MPELCSKCGAAVTNEVVCATCHRAVLDDLQGRNLANARLHGADLRGVDLSRADLRGADLSDADLRGAKLHGVDVKGANLDGTKIDNTYSQFLTGHRLKGYSGRPSWQVAADQPKATRFEVNGHPIRCPCCGGESFASGTALLETRGMVLLDLGWMNAEAIVLTCTACSRIEWFRKAPTPRP